MTPSTSNLTIHALVVLASFVGIGACSSTADIADSEGHGGPKDSGSVDSGSVDSGSVDSGSVDSGSIDSGSIDSGVDSSAPDGSAGCTGYAGVVCAANQPCVTGRCPNGSPVSCICQADGTFTHCTGACAP
jgi:hypothetical protein